MICYYRLSTSFGRAWRCFLQKSATHSCFPEHLPLCSVMAKTTAVVRHNIMLSFPPPSLLQTYQPYSRATSMIEDLHYMPAAEEHAENIMELLQDQFRKHEPINASINATEDDLIDVFRDDVKCAYTNEKYGTLAYDGNRLVGMCLCSMILNKSKDPVELDIKNLPVEMDIRKHDFAKDILNGPYKQHKANQIVVFVRTLEEIMQQMLSKYKILKMNVLSVHEDCMGKGLGKELNRRAIQIAKDEKCDYIATVATAMASQAIFRKSGWEILYEVPYSDYCENGSPVFQKLHDGCRNLELRESAASEVFQNM
ncbi:unnamed protein product [Cylicocyclus nassatus]|uniref:N-acetyltransferase domain-containing protein n=1 Tax=Cylicocyclus nassatus TaxID=53992 RepID=A0AA36GWX1_CYLNA|nr:unnamed protein product [Cylicocyclus nassatus]